MGAAISTTGTFNLEAASAEEVSAFVGNLSDGMGDLAGAIRKAAINGKVLASCTRDELKAILVEIGITSVAHQVRLIAEWNAMKERHAAGHSAGAVAHAGMAQGITISLPSAIACDDVIETPAATVFAGKSAGGAGPTGNGNALQGPVPGTSRPVLTASAVRVVEDNVPLVGTVTSSPRDILSDVFSNQGMECDPSSLKNCAAELTAVLTERCQSIDSTDKVYDCFISYRVDADKDVAEKLYLMLKLKGLNPFLDKACLPCGEAWQINFLNALRLSKCCVALISTAGLAPARNHLIDHSADSLLLEYQTALEVNKKRIRDSNPQFIIPVHIGQLEGKRLTKFADSGFALGQYSGSVTALTYLSGSTDLDLYEDDWGPWRYTGEVLNGKRHGSGTCTWHKHPGGGVAVYTGQWQSGRMFGEGKLTRPDGNVYEGQLQAGKMHGRGTYTWATGRVYEGDYVLDMQQGTGKYRYDNGHVYEGQWHKGMIHGWGTMRDANGAVEYVGRWENDEPVA